MSLTSIVIAIVQRLLSPALRCVHAIRSRLHNLLLALMSFQEAGSIWSLKSPICVCTEQHANWSISDKTVAIVGTGAYYPPNRKSAADLKDIISKVHELDSM